MGVAASRWSDALAAWTIPARILAAAPASPYVYPHQMFRTTADDAADTPSMSAAAAALGAGGTVLDVGCGGGRSSLPLARLLTHLVGVDQNSAMLDQLRRDAERSNVSLDTVLGRWPDVAAHVGVVDVVVCHHVVYNVGDIESFVTALDAHARRAVVIELTMVHPQSPLNHLWHHFWHLDRPSEPTADTFVDVVRDLGHQPTVEHFRRAPRAAPLTPDELVVHVRQRLCLAPDRDPEIAEMLGPNPHLAADDLVTVSWPAHATAIAMRGTPAIDGTSPTDLVAARIATVRDHMALESACDWDAVIATFERPRYEMYGDGRVFDGEAAVRGYFAASRTPFPDQGTRSSRSVQMPLSTPCWWSSG